MRDSLVLDPSIPSPLYKPDVTPVIDHVKATEVVQTMVEIGESKAKLSAPNIFVRGMYGGALLAFATSISFLFDVQLGGKVLIAGALLFPVGFIIINLLGVDLITGYFALTPIAVANGRLTVPGMLRAWVCVWAGNLAGSLLYVLMLWIAFSMAGMEPEKVTPAAAAAAAAAAAPGSTPTLVAGQPTGLTAFIMNVAAAKTVHYEPFGFAGMFTAFVKGILCNWMVTLGVIVPYASRSAIGKAIATFVPIFMFFAMGYEHMVVNMFIIPAAMAFQGAYAPELLPASMHGHYITMYDFWVANEIPVTIGNFVGGAVFTAAALGYIFGSKKSSKDDPLIQPTVASARV